MIKEKLNIKPDKHMQWIMTWAFLNAVRNRE